MYKFQVFFVKVGTGWVDATGQLLTSDTCYAKPLTLKAAKSQKKKWLKRISGFDMDVEIFSLSGDDVEKCNL